MADTEITIRPNGPYRVSGPIKLLDSDGNAVDLGGRDVFALCRCGSSSNKPFCDGTHGKVGFDGTLGKKEG